MTDFSFENHGSICILRPLTQEAKDWLESKVSAEDFQPYWPSVIIEPRYADNLLEGIVADGLEVA